MNDESEVVRYAVDYASDDGMMVSDYGNWVTHDDYRALEEELAALRGKVGELVEADRSYSEATNDWGQKPGGDKEKIAAVMAAAGRKREAMDALS